MRFLGLSLSGGKSDKSCLAVVDFYKGQKRLFLSRFHEKIKSEEFISADLKIVEMVEQLSEGLKAVVVDAPLTLPHCLSCELKCPGFESCSVTEIKWMRKFAQGTQKKKPRKMITPYTQRPVDLFLTEVEDENLDPHHALGANLGPMTARALFLQRRLKTPCFETFPKLVVWRLGLELKLNKSVLRTYRNSSGGEEARRIFLTAFVEKTGMFIYQADIKLICENPHAFDSLICAYVGLLHEQGKTVKAPGDFPQRSGWTLFPPGPGHSD